MEKIFYNFLFLSQNIFIMVEMITIQLGTIKCALSNPAIKFGGFLNATLSLLVKKKMAKFSTRTDF